MPRGGMHRASVPSIAASETALLAEEDECELEAKHRLLHMSLQVRVWGWYRGWYRSVPGCQYGLACDPGCALMMHTTGCGRYIMYVYIYRLPAHITATMRMRATPWVEVMSLNS